MSKTRHSPICNPQEMCAFFSAINVLNEKWVLHIITVLMGGPIGFNELSRMAQKINTTTLSQRLQLLENEGIITRTVQSTIPPKTSYELTSKGLAFRPTLDAIRTWALENIPMENPPESPDCQPSTAKLATPTPIRASNSKMARSQGKRNAA
jgi:DNA-binding HxlR family transcriptional regulator